jgi:hypothetical protein
MTRGAAMLMALLWGGGRGLVALDRTRSFVWKAARGLSGEAWCVFRLGGYLGGGGPDGEFGGRFC